MKNYCIVLFVFFTSSVMGQINLNKLEGDFNKAEKTIKTPSSNTNNNINSNTTNQNTGTPPPSTNSGAALSSLSDGDVAQGLKDALTQGATKASQSLNVVDGYYKNPLVKIPFPPEAANMANELRKLGFGAKVDAFELTLNRSAEQAAIEAAPIFKNAIIGMNINDAKSILTGSDTSATFYLRRTTNSSLYASFSPHIQKALNDNSATSKWAELAKVYNELPTTRKKLNPDLIAYTTNMALKGLFVLVAQEEVNIRQNPIFRTTDLLKKVFGSL
ncbi:MAG TPA: DUF4197 domain-containing protein [Cytophagaceae bacterium]|jgi:hypothetical protein|nr:DUF4197 domain-containing protein [Cytophagaceae bacterium]